MVSGSFDETGIGARVVRGAGPRTGTSGIHTARGDNSGSDFSFFLVFFFSLSLVFLSCFSLASRSLVIIVEHHDNERMHYRGGLLLIFFSRGS